MSVSPDQPDYQLGVVSAQQLLTSSPAGITELPNIGLPPNCETLVVMVRQTPGTVGKVSVQGVTSGLEYVGVAIPVSAASSNSSTYMFDVSTVIDTQVDIFFQDATTGPCWVYADAGVHLATDPSIAANTNGVEYVIPTVPSTAGSDHPAVELSTFGGNAGATGVIVAAPGNFKRIRLFYAGMINDGGSGAGTLQDSNTGYVYCICTGASSGYMPYVPQGIPLSQNASLNFENLFAANTALVWGGYTVETI